LQCDGCALSAAQEDDIVSTALTPVSIDRKYRQHAVGLGLFGIGLGLVELSAPAAVSRWIGARNTPPTRRILRAFGVREILSGIGLLTRRDVQTGMWARVAGDAMDLAALCAFLTSGRRGSARRIGSLAAIAGVAALDVAVALETGRRNKE